DDAGQRPQTSTLADASWPSRAGRLDASKRGDVTAPGQLDDDGVCAALVDVILGQPRPKSSGLSTDDRVLLRVVIGLAVKHLDSDHRFLELVVPTLEVPLHQKPQK